MRTLSGRLTLLVTLVMAVVLAAVAVVAVTEVARRERASLDRELRSSADRLAAPARRAIAAPRLAERPQSPLATVPGTLSVRLLRGGEVVFDDLRAPGVPVPAANGLTTVTDDAGGHWRVLARTVRPRAQGRLVVSTPLAALEQRLRDLRRVIALAALAGLIACALAVRRLATRALRPLNRLRESAASVSTTRDLTTRVDATAGPEEVDDVARSLNAMLARLEASAAAGEQALEAARRFTADAGHELRTPLTSIRANLAALHHGPDPTALAEVERDLVRLTALLDGLQALARGDAGVGGRDAVDVAELADAALADARRRHPEVDFAFGEAGELALEGDEAGLRAALDNLLENAARHGARTVRLSIGEHRVTVDDDGPGIPEAERERVFERFARGRGVSTPGSGLGLAVVAQQAALHGGRAYAEPSALGGARVVLGLKRVRPL